MLRFAQTFLLRYQIPFDTDKHFTAHTLSDNANRPWGRNTPANSVCRPTGLAYFCAHTWQPMSEGYTALSHLRQAAAYISPTVATAIGYSAIRHATEPLTTGCTALFLHKKARYNQLQRAFFVSQAAAIARPSGPPYRVGFAQIKIFGHPLGLCGKLQQQSAGTPHSPKSGPIS